MIFCFFDTLSIKIKLNQVKIYCALCIEVKKFAHRYLKMHFIFPSPPPFSFPKIISICNVCQAFLSKIIFQGVSTKELKFLSETELSLFKLMEP